jgi:serine/threonine-protein kinase
MNRRVALKELSMPGGASDKQRQERLARFQREAKAAGSLSHPNIVTIYEVGEDSGRAYIAMEYLEGQNLREKLDVVGTLPQEEAVNIIIEVLKALQYAHEHGIVHRDIKPDNIQLLPDGRVKITDFGIARLMFEPNLTMDGQIFGTPSYMSPEQVVGREIDARTDIWGCGVVLYEAIAGQKPFTGDSVVAISHAITNLEPNDPAHASFSVSRVVLRALDKSPGNRYATATAAADALKEALSNVDLGVPPSQPTIYGGPTPYGPPIDPYAPQQPSPYGQPYGGQPQLPPVFQFPPGWSAKPPRRPLLSPAASEFLRRTVTVILVGAIAIGAGFLGVAYLNQAADKPSLDRVNSRTAQRLIDEAALLKSRASATTDIGERLALMQNALEKADDAVSKAPDGQPKRTVSREACLIAMMYARECDAAGSKDSAGIAAQRAVRFADLSENDALGQQARRLQRQLSEN